MPFDQPDNGVNTTTLLELADFVENTSHKFDMKHWEHSCGSPSCIGGHAGFLFLGYESFGFEVVA